MKKVFLTALVAFMGCSHGSQPDVAKVTRLKDFIAKSDVVLIRRFFDVVEVSSTTPKDQPGMVSLRYTPGTLRIEPQVVTVDGKPGQKVKGAYLQLIEYKWVIAGGLSPEHGGGESEVAAIDDDELLDFQAAIESMQMTERSWAEKAPEVHTEISFEVRDRFKLKMIEGSPAAYEAAIGSRSIPLSGTQVDQLLRGLKRINNTLKSN